MTKEQFGQTIKQKYPQYQNVNDTILADKILEKYPEYSSKITESAPEPLPILTKESGNLMDNLNTATKDIAVGAGKELLGTARDVAGALQGAGQRIISGFSGTPIEEVQKTTGFKSLDNSTPEGAGVEETLASKSKGEQVGKVLSTAAQLAGGFIAGGGEKVAKTAADALKAGQKARAVEKPIAKALDAITPTTKELTSAEYEKLLSQNRITPKTATKPAKYILSDAEKETATKYQKLLQGADPVKNSTNIMNEIASQDKQVGEFLKANNGIFSNGELKNSILARLEGVSDVTIPESRLTKLKNTMVSNFLKTLPKNDMETLWKARKTFDQQIEKAFSGSPTLQNTIKREFRNSIQDFIAERTPEGVYKGYMKDMTNLFNLQDTVATKAAKEKSLTGIVKWFKDNPIKARIIGGFAGYEAAKKLGIVP